MPANQRLRSPAPFAPRETSLLLENGLGNLGSQLPGQFVFIRPAASSSLDLADRENAHSTLPRVPFLLPDGKRHITDKEKRTVIERVLHYKHIGNTLARHCLARIAARKNRKYHDNSNMVRDPYCEMQSCCLS